MKPLFTILVGVLLAGAAFSQGTWTAITALAPHSSGGGMLLLSDGTVLVKSTSGGTDGIGSTYDKLTPNSSGSYINGTWSSIASMAKTRLYYSSQVLKDGRVYVAGGEYGTGGSSGEVYNPLTNTWTSTPAPGSTVSDANSEILEDGRILQALVSGSLTGTKIYDPVSNTYITGPTALGIHNESAWVKLPDNSILYVNRLNTSSERYIPATNTWIADATVPVQLYDAFGDETGGALLLPDGRALFLGSAGHNAYYTPSGSTTPGTWLAAPDFPNAKGTPDAPAAMMVNGKVLCNASPVPTSSNHFPTPTTFYEFDPTTNIFTAINAPGGGATLNVSTYVTCFLNLPDGNILYSKQGSNQYYVYVSDGSPIAAGKPVVSNIVQTGTNTYKITGTQFNGISQGSTYGDDWQMNTNYPIIRLTSGTNVYYARTSNWNSTGVRRGTAADTATFTIPSGLANVPYSLYVVANGIASDAFPFSLSPTAGVTIAITSGSNPSCDGSSVTFTATSINGGTLPAYQWKVNGTDAGTNSSVYSTSTLTNGQIVTCVMTSNLAGVLGNPATSTGITMVINAPSPASVSIAASTTTICSGTAVTFTATPTNGGSSPSYQWKVDGVNAGTNSSTFVTSTLTNGQVVTCDMISNSTCVTSSIATSNAVAITVSTNSTPSVTIAATSTLVCAGTQVTFTATPVNAGLTPVYQWKVDGVNSGTNSPTYSSTSLSNGQVVSCVLNSSSVCAVTASLGTGTNTNATNSDLGAAYPTYYGNGRQQYLIKASELTALGLIAGNITAVGFKINGTTGDPATLFGYTIKMAATSVTALTSTFQSPTFTTVFGPSNYAPVLNTVNTHSFSTPFSWNGTSNILVEICFSNQVTGTIAYQSYQTTSSFVSTTYYQADGSGGAAACSQATGPGTGSVRPNMTFTAAAALTATSNGITMTINPLPVVTADNVSGCPGNSIALSGTPAGGTWSVANPYTGTSTTYTHTFTDGNGCANTSAAANITVAPPVVSFSGLAASYNIGAAPVTLTGSPAGGIFSGTGISGNTFSPAIAGLGGPYTITYFYDNGNGCSNTASQQTTVTNCTIPVTPGTITGQLSGVCSSTKSYSIAAVAGATSYTWSVPAGASISSGQGTVNLSASFTSSFSSGNISVVAGNTCGNSGASAITVAGVPAQPGTITGPVSVCHNQSNIVYSIAAVTGATSYTWTVPAGTTIRTGQGTTSIKVRFGNSAGNVTVTPVNACGSGTIKSVAVAMPCRDESIDISETILDLNVFPNPFTDKTTVTFMPSQDEDAAISIYDITGKELLVLFDGKANGDETYTLTFDGSSFPQGIYFLRLETSNGENFVKKLMLHR
ncbi:MAG: T9SS type A sorting domain-containing protein [Chitinophagaceae bacterium]|nr:T9SS type A sorting domain-containing protein [Chitinophagaceae bacterium]